MLPAYVAEAGADTLDPSRVAEIWRSVLKDRAETTPPCKEQARITRECARTKNSYTEIGLFLIRKESISLMLVETENGKEVFFASAQPADEAAVRELLVRAFDPGSYAGTITIKADDADQPKRWTVDGLPVEQPSVRVLAGTHVIDAPGIGVAREPPSPVPYFVGSALIAGGLLSAGVGALVAVYGSGAGGYGPTVVPLAAGALGSAVLVPAGIATLVLRETF